MDNDSNCLFVDIASCKEMETFCDYLCKPPTNPDDHPSLLGCNTKTEALLLQYGKFDIHPCSVEEFHVYNNHVNLISSSLLNICCLCRPFSRS